MALYECAKFVDFEKRYGRLVLPVQMENLSGKFIFLWSVSVAATVLPVVYDDYLTGNRSVPWQLGAGDGMVLISGNGGAV